MNQLAMAFPTAWPTTIDERYALWRATPAGREVYAECVRRAHRLRAAGLAHYGIKAIVESIRFDRSVRVGTDEEGYKVNNVFTAPLAREIMRKEEALDGFFETRRRHALGADPE